MAPAADPLLREFAKLVEVRSSAPRKDSSHAEFIEHFKKLEAGRGLTSFGGIHRDTRPFHERLSPRTLAAAASPDVHDALADASCPEAALAALSRRARNTHAPLAVTPEVRHGHRLVMARIISERCFTSMFEAFSAGRLGEDQVVAIFRGWSALALLADTEDPGVLDLGHGLALRLARRQVKGAAQAETVAQEALSNYVMNPRDFGRVRALSSERDAWALFVTVMQNLVKNAREAAEKGNLGPAPRTRRLHGRRAPAGRAKKNS